MSNYLKYKISVFPNFWFTSKPKSVRMGKGKGEKKRKIYFLKKGQIIYELRLLSCNSSRIFNKSFLLYLINIKMIFFLLKLRHKLPFKNKIVIKIF